LTDLGVDVIQLRSVRPKDDRKRSSGFGLFAGGLLLLSSSIFYILVCLGWGGFHL